MPICYVIGGLGESSLSRNPEGTGAVWIDPATLMLGQVGQMRLAPDGTSPGPPDGVALSASSVIGPYCGLPAVQLGAQLVRSGYSTRTHAWDWRMSLYAAGVALAGRLRAEVTAADPCALVCHSAGGLVARAAWTELGLTGQQALIRRIVTLGTPHWGSYSAVRFFQGANQAIDILEYWNQSVGYNTAGYAPDLFGYQYLDTNFYQQLAMTWPGLYDCLPVLGAPDAAADPNRPLLYEAASWPAAARPQQAWLDYARDHTGPWLRSPASLPPPAVLTCVSGIAETTFGALTDPAGFAQGGGVGRLVTGDGTVTQASAELGDGPTFRYTLDHISLLPALVARGEVAELVLAPPPPTPAPPPEVDTALPAAVIPALPAAALPDQTGGAVRLCGGVVCSC